MTPRPRTGPGKADSPAPKPGPGGPAKARAGKAPAAKAPAAKAPAGKIAAGKAPAAEPEPEEPVGGWRESALRVAATIVAVWAAALLAVFGAFLTPFRLGGVLVPISLVLGIGGNIGIAWFAFRTSGNKWLALLPGVVWVLLTFVAAGLTTERDLVLYQGNWVAITYLYSGCAAVGVCAYRLIVPKVPPRP